VCRTAPTSGLDADVAGEVHTQRGESLQAEEGGSMKEVTCMCGWRCRGTEDEIVAQVQQHGRETHGTEATRDEILALAVDAR